MLYDDFLEGLQEELNIFRSVFKVIPECISIHRPVEYFLNYDAPLAGVRHTYQSRYFSRIRYFSDSRGSFCYGHPLESDAFAKGKSIHLLIHPVWWVTDATSPVDVLEGFLERRMQHFKEHMAQNCRTYEKISGEHS
jgi:hypothetical protein